MRKMACRGCHYRQCTIQISENLLKDTYVGCCFGFILFIYFIFIVVDFKFRNHIVSGALNIFIKLILSQRPWNTMYSGLFNQIIYQSNLLNDIIHSKL